MSQYKVPQNVEAEDKILGPLTFKQFIYACIGVGWAIVSFALLRFVPPLLIIVGFPPTLLFLLLAFYTRDGQNFEQILLAMVGFFAATRKRLWVKENVTESFHVEPTKVKQEVSQRNPAEVRSELEKLATLIDSRGWNQPPQPGTLQILPQTPHDQRLVAPPQIPHGPDEPKSDIFDLQKNPLAGSLTQLLAEASENIRAQAMQQVNQSAPGPAIGAIGVAAGPAISTSGVTPAATADILRLATQNDDLSVAQIQAQATRNQASFGPTQQVDTRTNGG